mgnify:CR=1 FL=1
MLFIVREQIYKLKKTVFRLWVYPIIQLSTLLWYWFQQWSPHLRLISQLRVAPPLRVVHPFRVVPQPRQLVRQLHVWILFRFLITITFTGDSHTHILIQSFFPRVILLYLYREPKPQKTQKAPHHRPQTPLKSQPQKTQSTTPNLHIWAKMRKKAKRIPFVKDFPFPEQITSKPLKINSIIQLKKASKKLRKDLLKKNGS